MINFALFKAVSLRQKAFICVMIGGAKQSKVNKVWTAGLEFFENKCMFSILTMPYHRSEGLKNNPNESVMTYLPLFNVTKTLCKHEATTTLIMNLH